MSKTPEELAEEAINERWKISDMPTSREGYVNTLLIRIGGYRDGFLAGYKAAQEHAHAALEEAEVRIQELQDQLADTSKVMNSPENPDSCEHILDMSKMVNVNGWISVKDKSPEINQRVLLATNEKRSIVTGYRLSPAGKNEPWFHTDLGLWCGTETVTHWMPLPEPPKEEK